MPAKSGVNRRSFLVAGAGVGAGLAGSLVSGAPVSAQPADTSTIVDDLAAGQLAGSAAGRVQAVHLRTGTDLAAQVSPDGRSVAYDTVGVLWIAPMAGGTARRLTDDFHDITQPDWSPDGSKLAFQSYRGGQFNLWIISRDGTHPRQLTHGPYDHREPRWSPDGRYLAFSSDLAGSYAIYTYDLKTADIALIADTPSEEYEPVWSPDGHKIAFVVGDVAIAVVDITTGVRSIALTVPAGQIIHAPAFTPDGRALVYSLTANGHCQLMRSGAPLVTDQEVFPFRVSWLSGDKFVYTADGRIRTRSISTGETRNIDVVAQVQTVTPSYSKRQRDFQTQRQQQVIGIGSPVLAPDGKKVAFRALNDIYVMSIGQRPVALTNDQFWKSDPAWSPDGKQLSYSSDRGGHLEIWVRNLRTGHDVRVASLPAAAAVSGSWSHDGKSLAFLDQNGAVYTVVIATGDIQRIYPATFEPGRPTWSPDGDTVAIAAIKPYSARYREGLSEILTINRHTGVATYHQALPNRSLQTRGDDGPVWSPDGRLMAFVVASVLWVLPVAVDGTPAGTARQITNEVTDAPSWSGNSSELLYLSNGRLRIVSADGRRTRTVTVPLTWKNSSPAGRTVIRAGQVWDGLSQNLRDDVDIIIDGNRITAVEPHRVGTPGRTVDASNAVVIPGLIDIHNHREMQGYSYGDRQGRMWLALGITTTRSPGSPAYHMVEERESFQAGKRVGPRYFGTGEAIDGSRIFYNFMRPTYDEDQLDLEFQRAVALDYDLMKSYVRLDTARQQKLIQFAHEHLIHATSHYHYPAFAFGGDGTEHVGATNRFGFSRTVTASGTGYADVTDLFAAAGARRTPTLFGAVTMFREDRSLVDDPRVRALYPPWEYQTLIAAATSASTTDQKVNRENLAAQVKQLVDLLAAGGHVVTGTDSPIDHTAVSTHMNLRAMVKYGISPHQALVSATSATGKYLNEPIGQIAVGMLADLCILGGNPLADITQAANVQHVMVNGYLHTPADLSAPFARGAAAIATGRIVANRMLASVPVPDSESRYWWHHPQYLTDSKRSCCAEGS